MKVLILHLSDIHLKATGNAATEKFPAIGKAIQNLEFDLDAVAVVVSGDIAFSGSAEEYRIAKDLLTNLQVDIQTRCRVSCVETYFVPGNHDCDFSARNGARETIINAIRKGVSAPIDSAIVELCTDVQAEFFKFRDSFPCSPTIAENRAYWEYLLAHNGSRILFRCFNTAWLSQLHEQQGGLYFPDIFIADSEPKTKADFNVAIFHHPYNWFPAATYRQFRTHIEKTSDLILTGHEHEPDHYQKYTFRGEVNEYLEGAVFQEAGHPERSGFHAIYIDLAAQQQRIVSCSWENGIFVQVQPANDWTPYRRGSRANIRDFSLAEAFQRWLEDPGTMFTHPAKQGDLTLRDIFVFPNAKEFRINEKNEFVYGSLIEGRDLLKTLGSQKRTLIFGRQQSGKTTMAKVLFRDFYNKGLTPIMISGQDISASELNIEKFEAVVSKKFQEQYENPLLPKFQQLDRDRSLIIIDDFDHVRLNPKGKLKLLRTLEKRYERIFVFADDVVKLEEIANGKESSEILGDYTQFELVQFGYLLRSKLIAQWYSIGSEFVSDSEVLAKRIHTAETLITSLLGKNFLPSYPVFILSLLQAHDSGSQLNSNVGTYGGLYEVLIVQTLATKSKGGNLDLKKTYLSELAYWMFSSQKRRITDEEWSRFHGEYCSKFKIKPSRQDLKREFMDSALLEQLDQRFGFRHFYAYYYFVARYLRDNIANPEIKRVLEALCERLDKEENASIWLFLTHLSKDPFLVDVILKHAQETYKRFKPATFSDDVSFMQSIADSLEQVVLEDKDFEEIKEDRLRKLDELPTVSETSALSVADRSALAITEEDKVLQLISELNVALKTLEVLGQIVKNFPGSLIGKDKFALVKEAYELGLRTVTMFFDLFHTNADEFVELVVEHITETRPELKERSRRADLEKNTKKFLFWMVETCSFGLIKRISHAVGHSQLGETYTEVLQANNTNAVALVDVSVQLDNLGLPIDLLDELSRKFRNNVFCERVLKQMVVQHFYLFPTREKTKQQVCELLQIPIKNLRGIDAVSAEEKLSPN